MLARIFPFLLFFTVHSNANLNDFPTLFAKHYASQYNFDSIMLEDGSLWLVKPSDREKLFFWNFTDFIIISQNHCWISTYNYLLTNQTLNEQVAVNLSMGPIINGPYTHYVAGIDLNNGYLLLDDGTRWKVSSYDLSSLWDWYPSDPVIIGVNNAWFSECSYILINVSLNKYIRAHFL